MTYEEARAAVRANPDDADAWFVLGTLEDAVGNSAQASAAFRRVLVLDPFMQDAHEALTRLQEERVLEFARDSLAKEGVNALPFPPPPTRARWPLFALLLLVMGVAALLYLNFRGSAVISADPATDALEVKTPTPTISSPLPTVRTEIGYPTSMAPLPVVTATVLTTPRAYKQIAHTRPHRFS